eukprot:CAMPEP_0119311478 /NCGR_PEP_ID=MMETSP1333-20130426/22552_1 /TAXON_ID=418940 /ORGANISM="Scyphosphaera apsteinii, Strain RCC1455" /LENGTH=164 /DNA_ID=CAMNT_0007315857 /DNA_START=23 /DNA_END=517 /DNA_ORIENTATION=+
MTWLLSALACQGYFLPGRLSVTPMTAARAIPMANLFESLAKIAEYNKRYWSTAAAALFDERTAKASHILFGFQKYEDGEIRAAQLKARIEEGEISFTDAAKQFSTCPSAARGGDLGTFKRGAMVPEFDETVFNVDVPLGAISGPVKTQFGHHLIQVVERAAKKE